MSDLALRLRGQVARLLAAVRTAARAVVPVRVRRRLARAARRHVGGAASLVESPYWYDLGHRYLREGQERSAAAFVAAFERGSLLLLTTLQMHITGVHQEMRKPANVQRMRDIAAANPRSWASQLGVGAFLLDQGHLDEGRAAVRRGHEVLLGSDAPALVPQRDGAPISTGPDFLIIGPQKTGTTSLHALVCEHPNVVPPPRKELHFWGHRRDRPLAVYEAYFPALRDGFITGEATPTYLHLAEAVDGVAAHYPAIRVVAMHREPVARAYSHYQMRRRGGQEPRSFEEAVADELDVLGPTAPVRTVPAVTSALCPYLLGSTILPYLLRWVGAVGPERMLIVESAALSRERQRTVDAVHHFLGLPASSGEGVENRGVSEYDPVPPNVAARLHAWFAPHEHALDEFLAGHPNVVRLGHA